MLPLVNYRLKLLGFMVIKRWLVILYSWLPWHHSEVPFPGVSKCTCSVDARLGHMICLASPRIRVEMTVYPMLFHHSTYVQPPPLLGSLFPKGSLPTPLVAIASWVRGTWCVVETATLCFWDCCVCHSARLSRTGTHAVFWSSAGWPLWKVRYRRFPNSPYLHKPRSQPIHFTRLSVCILCSLSVQQVTRDSQQFIVRWIWYSVVFPTVD